MRTRLSILVLATTLASCATAAPRSPITSLSFTFPEDVTWTQITNHSEGGQYLREWVPEGSTGTDTKWIIVEQKLVGAPLSAKEVLLRIYALGEKTCTDVSFTPPVEIRAAGHRSAVGRFICSQQIGKEYGTFTDQRVAVQGGELYILTSELRLPGSPVAGTFGGDAVDEEAAARIFNDFVDLQAQSAAFVQSARICTEDQPDC